MRIITLRAENVKRLKAVEITPDGDMVIVSGRNAQGKSSVLDAIWMALAGAQGAKETRRPIRDGEEKAEVTLDLGGLLVTRQWSDAGTTLTVTAPDGARYSSPQTMLDALIGRLSFDPLAFANQDPKAQLASLLDVVDLPFDPDELARRRAGIYEQRTEVNREVKRLEALLSAIEPPDDDTPDEEVSAAAIAAELEQATSAGVDRARAIEQLRSAEAAVVGARAALEQAEANLAERAKALNALPEPVDAGPIRARLEAADATNEMVRAKRERAEIDTHLTREREMSEQLTAKLEAIDQEKAAAIAAAKMPLDGLSFDDDGVLYQGVPFSQASASERLRVGIAMAMALNPKIRVIRITDGSLLDTENLELIRSMAADNDFQVWVERVDETGQVGVVIEDGEVANPKAKAKAA